MPAALPFNIPIISSRLPGRTVNFAINPHISLASCEPARMGVSVTAPTSDRDFRSVYSQLSNIQVVVGEWNALRLHGSAVRNQRERFPYQRGRKAPAFRPGI